MQSSRSQIEIFANFELLAYERGELVARRESKNRVVRGGRDHLVDLCLAGFGSAALSLQYMAFGSASTTVGDNDTALGAEIIRKILARRDAGDSAFTVQAFVDTTEANGSGSQAINEAGLFIYAGGGPMFARTTFSTITKTVSISIIGNWTITFAAV